MDFWTKLEQSSRRTHSLLCVGLDPQPGKLPQGQTDLLAWLKGVVDATHDYACIYKPNIAFFEALGRPGLDILSELLAYIPDETPVLLDAKRGDISSTAEAYARAVYESWGVDAVTVSPYLGRDGVEPFLNYGDRGVFVLCKTSNPSAGEVQDWEQNGLALYQHVADLALEWAGERSIGLVVGATYPQAVQELRARCGSAWFLIPGIGAQGGDLEAVLRAGLRPDGLGLLINSSRGIIYAPDPAEAAGSLRNQINAVRENLRVTAPTGQPWPVRRLAFLLHQAGCVRFGEFTLHSGAKSPIYVDLRRLVTYPAILSEVSAAYARLLEPLQYDRIAAIPYAALPIGTAVSLHIGRPLIYPRREAKAYGTRKAIEGEYTSGETAVLLDDLISSGGSKLEAIAPLEEEGLTVKDVVVLIDRQQGGREDLAAKGYRLHAAVTLIDLVEALEQDGHITTEEARRVRDYLLAQ